MKILNCIIWLILLNIFSFPAYAYRVVATVNDEPISDCDVSSRVSLLRFLLKMPDEVAQSENFQSKILDALIEEKLKVQEAKSLGLSLSPAEIQNGIAFLEQQNQFKKDELIQKIQKEGIDIASLENQVKSELLWLKVIKKKNENPPVVTKQEIRKALDKMKIEAQKSAYLLAEIYIPFALDSEKARAQIEDVFNKIVKGASFPELAAQYSKNETASLGGDLGWVRSGEMEKVVDDLLPFINKGQLSRPIKGEKGYYLILMRDKHEGTKGTEKKVWRVSQLVVAQNMVQSILSEMSSGLTCSEFDALAVKTKMKESGSLGEIVVDEAPSYIRDLLKDAGVGHVRGPIKSGQNNLFLMKCDEKTISLLPSTDEIKMQLEMKKIEESARSLIQFLHRQSIIEKKG